MLAKIWKKALLVICIIACIYNVMHKLISRTSLEVQLKNIENISEIVSEEKTSETSSEAVNANTVNTETKSQDDTIVVIY